MKKRNNYTLWMSFQLISMTIAILFSCLTGWSQQPITHFTAHDFSRIRPQAIMQPLSFRIINSQEDTINIQTTVQSFQLANDQRIASFNTEEVFLNLREIPVEASILPEAFITRTSDQEQILFQLLVKQLSPFEYNNETGLFHGSIEIHPIQSKMEDLAQTQNEVITLNDPVMLIVEAFDKNQDTVYFSQINWPPIVVYLQADPKKKVITDLVTARVKTYGKIDGYETLLTVTPYIKISAGKGKIQGFGIQTIPVHISLSGVTTYQDIEAGLRTEKGYFEPDHVVLRAGEVSTVILRSEKFGETVIIATAPNLLSNTEMVFFVFPWSFLLFSIAGAVIGSLIYVLRSKRKGFNTKSFIVGILLGFTVSVSYWALGLDLLNMNLEIGYLNEFAVISLSILGGLLGGYIGRSKQKS